MTKDASFQKFFQRRIAASSAWVSGDAAPLAELLAESGDVTFLGPMGGVLSGAKKVAARYAQDSSRFSPGGSNKIDVLHAAASGDLGYAVYYQTTKAKMQGNPKRVPMALRVTEIFRRDRGEWKMIHRHADLHAKPESQTR